MTRCSVGGASLISVRTKLHTDSLAARWKSSRISTVSRFSWDSRLTIADSAARSGRLSVGPLQRRHQVFGEAGGIRLVFFRGEPGHGRAAR